MQNLFTYGSLMSEDIMSAVVGYSLQHEPAVLPGYGRYAVKNEQYPGVVPVKGSVVEGVVYHGIEQEVWERLDRFEGDMYSRRQVMVRYTDGRKHWVACYVVKPECRRMLTEKPWQFDTFLRHGKKVFQARYLGFKNIE